MRAVSCRTTWSMGSRSCSGSVDREGDPLRCIIIGPMSHRCTAWPCRFTRSRPGGGESTLTVDRRLGDGDAGDPSASDGGGG